MRLHCMSSEVGPSCSNHRASPQSSLIPQTAAEVATLTCSGCGKTERQHLHAKCSNKPGYRTTLARAHPLQQRDPKLYKRLDEMSRLPLRGNKQVSGMSSVQRSRRESTMNTYQPSLRYSRRGSGEPTH